MLPFNRPSGRFFCLYACILGNPMLLLGTLASLAITKSVLMRVEANREEITQIGMNLPIDHSHPYYNA